MNNKVIIILFALFAFVVFFSSLQTISHTQQVSNKLTPTIPTKTTNIPLVTPIPTATPIPTQIQHPGFRVNGGGEANDD